MLLLLCDEINAQPVTDNIPVADLQRAMNESRLVYDKLPALKQWLNTNGYVTNRSLSGHVLFDWPMRVTSDYDDIPNYYMIQNYVDEDATGNTLDWNCGQRTYDTHKGADISLYPFWWHMKYAKCVYAAAAAPGIVSSINIYYNNYNDASCVAGAPQSNYIAITHLDSSISFYYHVSSIDLQLDGIGQFVNTGDLLDAVASNGSSTNPHLHFEVHDVNNNIIDPWVGANPNTDCNVLNNDSWWQNQKPYWEPGINKIMTHSANPKLQGYNGNTDFCPPGELSEAQNSFSPGDNMYIGIALHDMLAGSTVSYSITNPTGSAVLFGSFINSSANNLSRAYFAQSIGIGAGAITGTYKIIASYQGNSFAHYYTVGCTPDYTPTGNLTGDNGFIAGNSIVSDAVLSNTSKTVFQSANVIQLNPGFTATQGCVFKAKIRDCSYTQ